MLCAFAFTACGNNEDTEPSFPKYNITLESNADYTLESDKTTAENFETVTITVTLKNYDKKTVGVKFNGENANKKSDGTFSFLMPSKDVTVSATLEDYTEQTASDDSRRPFMKFSSSNVKTLVPNSGDFSMYIDMNASYMTILKSEIHSSNQAVIPDDAFSIEKRFQSQSNIIIGTDLVVDTTKIAKGSTWVTIYYSNENVTSQKGTIVVKLTVDDKIDVELWTETLTIEIDSADESATYEIAVYNRDFKPGMPKELEYQFFSELQPQSGKLTVEIKYVAGQTFGLGLFKRTTEQSTPTEMTLLEAVGEGSSVTGFNQYKNGVLSFIRNGASLTIKAQ